MTDRRQLGGSAAILIVGRALSAGLRFVSVPILARALTPQDFGIAGVVLTIMALGAMMGGGSGFSAAASYYRGRGGAFDHTVFWATVGLALAAGIALWLLAAPLARTFGSPAATDLLRLTAWFLPLDVLGGFGYAILARQMRFRAITAIFVTSSISAALLAITLAWAGFGAGALAGQYIAFVSLKAMGFLLCGDYRPATRVSRTALRELLPYALRVTASDLAIWATREGPFLIVARSLGLTDAGAYRVADRFLALPRETVGDSIGAVAFNGMIDVSGAEALTVWQQTSKATVMILAPVYLGAAAVAEPLTRVVFGAQYAANWPVMAVLAVGMALQTLGSGAFSYLKARGQSAVLLTMSMGGAAATLVAAGLGALAWQTATGVAFGLMIARLAISAVFVGRMVRHHGAALGAYVTALWPSCAAAVLMAACVQPASRWLSGHLGPLGSLSLAVALGVVVYGAVLAILAPGDLSRMAGMLRDRFDRLRTGPRKV